MKKKIVGIITALVMLISSMPQVIINAEEDIAISTAQELKAFADSVNAGDTYEGKTVSLTQDIDLSEICGADINGEKISWTPIGTEDNSFNGTFDGNNHTISIYINTTYNDNPPQYLGLFGYTQSNASIKNLTIDGKIQVSTMFYFGGIPQNAVYYYVGAFVGYNKGHIENCHNKIWSLNVYGNTDYAGGISGCSLGGISRCSNNGMIYGSSGSSGTISGGICGIAGENARVTNCYNTGKITSFAEGGIAGYADNIDCITNCYNAATFGHYGGNGITENTCPSISNCYQIETEYLTEQEGVTIKTAEQFASGEVTYLLNGKTSDGDIAWYQNIGEDDFPVLDNTHSAVLFDGEKYYNGEPVPSNKINAYIGGFSTLEKDITTRKITSYAELEAYAEETDARGILTKYPSSFFEDKFLYVHYIEQGSGSSSYKISTVEEVENQINIEIIKEYEGATDDIFYWFLYVEAYKSLSEKDINVTIKKQQTTTYPYAISGLRITNTAGEEIEQVQKNTSFIVEADITKTEERNEKDYLFVAVYDTDNALISLDYVKAKFSVYGECSFGFNIPPQEKSVGSVKAFVWNTFNSMEPLAETKTLSFFE